MWAGLSGFLSSGDGYVGELLEFGQAPRVGDGQGSLACGSPWGHKESDKTEQLN